MIDIKKKIVDFGWRGGGRFPLLFLSFSLSSLSRVPPHAQTQQSSSITRIPSIPPSLHKTPSLHTSLCTSAHAPAPGTDTGTSCSMYR
jgi:hypothetical protein